MQKAPFRNKKKPETALEVNVIHSAVSGYRPKSLMRLMRLYGAPFAGELLLRHHHHLYPGARLQQFRHKGSNGGRGLCLHDGIVIGVIVKSILVH